MVSPARAQELVVVVAPTGADARNIDTVLRRAGLHTHIGSEAREAAAWVERGAGALLMTEEALLADREAELRDAFARQPAWADIPLVLVASPSSLHRWATLPPTVLGERSNLTLIARPLQASMLVAAVRTVLRARRRQFEVRDLLRERDQLLSSLEARVQERTAKLQELVAELETFSYSVSHDLRAPLRVMAGYANIVLEDFGPELPPEVQEYVRRIARSAQRMDHLTQDVLTYTRLARGEVPLEEIDVAAVVNGILDQYPKVAVARTAITLREPLARAQGHAPSLVQVLSNLIDNAVKFARPDVPLRIEISSVARDGRVTVSVKDNGTGIPAAQQGRIFRIFERAVDADVPGTGIGLAIVKKAAERMGGTVSVRSEPGSGSVFSVELAAPDSCAGATPASRAAKSIGASPKGTKRR